MNVRFSLSKQCSLLCYGMLCSSVLLIAGCSSEDESLQGYAISDQASVSEQPIENVRPVGTIPLREDTMLSQEDDFYGQSSLNQTHEDSTAVQAWIGQPLSTSPQQTTITFPGTLSLPNTLLTPLNRQIIHLPPDPQADVESSESDIWEAEGESIGSLEPDPTITPEIPHSPWPNPPTDESGHEFSVLPETKENATSIDEDQLFTIDFTLEDDIDIPENNTSTEELPEVQTDVGELFAAPDLAEIAEVDFPKYEAAVVPSEEENDALEQATAQPDSPLTASDETLAVQRKEATRIIKRAYALAERGMFYSARREFMRALRILSQAKDASKGGQEHSLALTAGLRALEEAEDFRPRGTRVERELELETIVSAHQTPVLQESDIATVSPIVALEAYQTYSAQQLGLAVAGEPAGSMALFGLAKLEVHFGKQGPESQLKNTERATALYRSALLSHPRNHLAANEAGVLLARQGRHLLAEEVLKRAIQLSPTQVGYHNLAKVYELQGKSELSGQIAQQAHFMAMRQNAPMMASKQGIVWVNPKVFTNSENTNLQNVQFARNPNAPPIGLPVHQAVNPQGRPMGYPAKVPHAIQSNRQAMAPGARQGFNPAWGMNGRY